MIGTDLSAALRPGVYILRDGARVVWIGRARRPATMLYAHLVHQRGKKPLPAMPREPVRFDGVEVRPCRVEDIDTSFAAVCEELRWAP